MKRQRGVKANGAVHPCIPMENPPPPPLLSKVEEVAAAMGMKKPKKEAEQKEVKTVVAVEEEEKKENIIDFAGAGLLLEDNGAVINGWNNWEENMPLFGGVVDETMPWGYTGFPGWDMDLTENYSDVVWDDDIWNLKNQIPNPILDM
ncbi:uncharacterized protein LOC130718696 [Lotus japonicus]|uniref:uncharacterized protein LOC130718696 n=1 Tax=Lotus japonicus TaxID=34305 RepID=UPI00258DD71A|nr:uncharacterized protein LOC130718696 [Lotus japonicus]